MKWNDETSYQRGESNRTPRTWTARAGRFRITMFRHRHFPADAWLVTCEPLFDTRQLKATDVEQAKAEAIALVREGLQEAVDALV